MIFKRLQKRISLRTSKGIWQPSLLIICGFIIAFTGFIALSFWQLYRAELKMAEMQIHASRFNTEALVLKPEQVLNWEKLKFRPSIIQGQWLHNKQFLQDNVTHKGISGYEVLSPLLLSDGSVIMVNRGWIAKIQFQQKNISLPKKTVELIGNWAPPLRRFTLGKDSWSTSYPIVIQVSEPKRLSQQLQATVHPYQFRLLEDQAHTFKNIWTPVFGNPDKNRAYALQWFLFGVILCFLFWKLNYKKIDDR